MRFSEIILDLRHENNLTQKELSKRIGISAAAIGFLETERNQPTADSLKAYADYFGVSVDYLLGREDDFGSITRQSKGEWSTEGIKINFSERFKTLREDHHLTQSELSKYLNISRSCISMIEIGRNDPTASTLLAYANYFQISTDFLLCREDDFGNITIQSDSPQMTDSERELLENFRALSPYLQGLAAEMLRNWAGKPAQKSESTTKRA